MDNTWQAAFADEVRAELGRQNRSARSAYTALGLSSSTWQGYFKRLDRAIPSSVMIAVANYLGLPLSELVRRAEDRERQLLAGNDGPAPDLSEHITRQLSPEAQAQVRAARAGMSERSRRGHPNV